ncbi:DNA-binding transcriptional regulator, MocR family, contains an aminotransferase domain [Candidatus Pantoea symbiotica]|jgi:DNA-binding transcriptional MocR family regulator|uniref:DNA-binding transcriptional regulator, MocR family, contains an aminotransferase domain n=1 Tax=Candidatus Pantoea symbiotica TaxID=1884370 RepID=A0A1I4B183_9GAMM|nr:MULTISPECIES: aminotransferase class I/II-fold pyridoxal phosphate-dependent enzyme [Pantoea]KAJ9433873.1 aminotransferase class I/II-fold pyridoxal phosphate-dependent enzyme [Pantoea sp. YR343]MRT22458.1 aminotransferase class I/II-fold pyridoxal phosphate-dependent enzyme [Enterobacteriaceae bacterium RIT697]SFK62130.1 DNA-binding transcriptional regulator, MocR family, contains an aminotransferase domain [Pantoea symbiotica]SFU97207.1 DNA-binding transcriptional regulator, MocR family, c
MTQSVDLEWLSQQITDASVKGITHAASTLIRDGQIAVGMQMPAVRELAERLGVSPATVSAAWAQLKKQKVLAGKGRSGVWVSGNSVMPRPIRFEKIGNYGENVQASLAMASPDPTLLPDLRQAMLAGIASPQLNSYQREAISPQLQDAVTPRWPYPAEAWLATDGGFDAMNLIVQTLLSPGDRVVIEDPTATRLLDILDNIGAEILPLPCDEQGPIPSALSALMQKSPAMFIYQPRTHSATGHSVSQRRSAELARVLANSSTIIVEDDGIGDLSRWPVFSLGFHYPERVLHVHSFSKAYGPDLRLAVLSGTAEMVKRLQAWRNFGVSWTSRILQDAVAWMLNDEQTQQRIQQAKATYAQRRQQLLAALAKRGLVLEERDGLSVWIPVESEQYAMITLAARGIAVLPGERCSINSRQFIRVSAALLPFAQLDSIADAIVIASGRELNLNPDL